MKKICITIAIFLIGCGEPGESRTATIHGPSVTNAENTTVLREPPPEFKVDNYSLRLEDIDDRCTLQYRKSNDQRWAEIDVGIVAPCDFIGRKIKTNPPQRYVVDNPSVRVTILLVTGGPPHPKAKDEFMPAGCGTQLAKVRVYSNNITIEPPLKTIENPLSELDANCPSEPLDEVFFATG